MKLTFVYILLVSFLLLTTSTCLLFAKKPVNWKHVKYMTSTFAGGNDGGEGFDAKKINLESPRSVFIDEQGDLIYIDGNTIKKVSKNDNIVRIIAGSYRVVGNGDDGKLAIQTDLNVPQSVIVSSSTGDMYFSDSSSHVIRKVDAITRKITTIAGVLASAGFNEDGLSNSTLLSSPMGIALKAETVMIFADSGNHRIRKIENGVIITIAGNSNPDFSGDNSLAIDATMNNPTCLFVDPLNGDIYFCDQNNNRIRKIDNSTGIISTVAGNGDAGDSAEEVLATETNLNSPNSIALSNGDLFFTDVNMVVRKVNASGYISTICGKGQTSSDGLAINTILDNPSGLFVNKQDIFVVDTGNKKIRKISQSNGIIETVVGSSTIYHGDGLPANQALFRGLSEILYSEGETVIADNCLLRKIDKNQQISTIAGNGVCASYSIPMVINPTEPIQHIYAIAQSPITKELYLTFESTIYKMLLNGTLIRIAGIDGTFAGDGGIATNAVLGSPTGFDFLPSGEMVFADLKNSRIRKISNSGIITTIAGNGINGYGGENVRAVDSSIGVVQNILISKIGEIYFSTRDRIQKIALNGNITTVAGGGQDVYGSGDATNANLNIPKGFAFSSNQQLLYIAVFQSDLLRVVNLATGKISTLKVVTKPMDIALTNDGLSILVLQYDFTLRILTISSLKYTIIAGTSGSPGYYGDDILASNALLAQATGVSVAPNNDIYISDDARVRKISNGIITTVAGNGEYEGDLSTQANATSVAPFFSKIGPDGALYISDKNFIRKVSNGTISTFAGGLGDGNIATEAYLCPNRMTFSSNGDLYFTDSCYANNIRRISYDTGIISTVAGKIYRGFSTQEIQAVDSSFNGPFAITFNSEGDIYFSENGNHYIRRISKDGVVHIFAGNGVQESNGDGSSAKLASIMTATSMVFATNGDLLFADGDAGVIRKISASDGNITTIIGSPSRKGYDYRDNVSGNETSIYNPSSIVIDNQGTIIYADSGDSSKENDKLMRIAVPYCESDYLLSDNNLTCIPTCFGKFGNSSCGGPSHGSCYDVNSCECELSWVGAECEIAFCFNKNGSDVCSGHGSCVSQQECQCNTGWIGTECETPVCFGKSGSEACGKGVCVHPGKCECLPNFMGELCNITTCNGLMSNSSQVCSSRGKCSEFEKCECDVGYGGINCEIGACFGVPFNSSLACSSHGKCIGDDLCECNNNWIGSSCNTPMCFGLSNSSSCSGSGVCIDVDICKCDKNYYGADCRLIQCFGKLSNDSNICSGHGSCTSTDSCKCSLGYTGSNCEKVIVIASSSGSIIINPKISERISTSSSLTSISFLHFVLSLLILSFSFNKIY